MEWFAVFALVTGLVGLGIVVRDAIKNANKG
jgi:hypothetical protein